jgi:hypothetical protein
MGRIVARAWRPLGQKGWAVCWCERLVIEPGSQAEPCGRGGRSPLRFSRRLRAHTGLVLGGRAADTDRRSFEARRPHASRSQQHTARGEPQESGAQRRRASVRSLPSKGTGSALERGECAVHRSGDSHRASEVRSHLTRRRYQYVRSQVQCAPGETQERQEKKKVLQRA